MHSSSGALLEHAATLTLIHRTANLRIKVRAAHLNTQSGCSAYSGFAFRMAYDERTFSVFKARRATGTCSYHRIRRVDVLHLLATVSPWLTVKGRSTYSRPGTLPEHAATIEYAEWLLFIFWLRFLHRLR